MRDAWRAKLEGPESPESLQYLTDILYQMHGRSGVGMSGLAPLSYDTIARWCELHETRLSSLEVNALVMLDSVLLSAQAERTNKTTPSPPAESASAEEMRRARRK